MAGAFTERDVRVQAALAETFVDGPVEGYLGDGSLCPTGLGVNRMITIMAMARHVGRTVLAEA